MIKFYLPVGTVTGTAESVAHALAEEIRARGHQAEVDADYEPGNLARQEPDILLPCCSNTGQGDIPDNLVPFYYELRNAPPRIAGLRYAIVNLGDSAYEHFGAAGRSLDQALADIGAVRQGEILTLDALETVDHEDDARRWFKTWYERYIDRKKIGLFYGSSTCYTEMAAEKIAAGMRGTSVELHNIADTDLKRCLDYSFLIMGIPTWDYGELQEDWENLWPQFDELDLSEHRVALFGLGDQIGYPQWFQDALGYLHERLRERGATLVGYWPVEGYQFEASQGLSTDKSQFVGLALDEENQAELSEERIRRWCEQVQREFGL